MANQLGSLRAEQNVSQILAENVISLSQAETMIEKTIGRRPSRATVCRWINSGKLQAIKMGRQLFTSEQAVHRYLVAKTATITTRN